MNGSGCNTCPAKDECRAQMYRGRMCRDNRAKHGYGDPFTNGDRVRTMTDEELANFLHEERCPGEHRAGVCDEDCKNCWLRYLQKPAEETTIPDTRDTVNIPCRIGDELWAFRNLNGKGGRVHRIVQKAEVTQMFFTKTMELILVLKPIGHRKFGESAFYTREEAERALKEKYHGD